MKAYEYRSMGSQKEAKGLQMKLEYLQKEVKYFLHGGANIMKDAFTNALSHVDLLCLSMEIPRELVDAKKEVVEGKLVGDEESLVVVFIYCACIQCQFSGF